MPVSRLLAAPFVATAVALGACGGSAANVPTGPSNATPAKAPQLLTARHDLKTFRLARGRSIELRLESGAQAQAKGSSVSLVPIEFLVDPGYAAWELSARGRGRTVVTASSAGRKLRLTLVVPG